MYKLVPGREPDPTQPPVRAFRGISGPRVKYPNLAELRAAMVEDDVALIDSMAKRDARDRATQQGYLDHRTSSFPAGHKRSFNLSHWLPDVLEEAQRRHPYEEGLRDVLEQTYPFIATETSPFQLYDCFIIDAIASRVNKVKQAVVFKRDRGEGLAPITQEANISRAVSLAEQRHPEDSGLPARVSQAYSALVPACVALQQTMFDRTYLLDDWDGLGFSGDELGLSYSTS